MPRTAWPGKSVWPNSYRALPEMRFGNCGSWGNPPPDDACGGWALLGNRVVGITGAVGFFDGVNGFRLLTVSRTRRKTDRFGCAGINGTGAARLADVLIGVNLIPVEPLEPT